MQKKQRILWIVIASLALIGIIFLLLVLWSATQNTKSISGTAVHPRVSTQLADTAQEAESFLAYDASGDYGQEVAMRTSEPVALDDGTVVDPKIIKTGNLELVVDDVDATSNQIEEIATANEGYVQQVSIAEQQDGTRAGTIIIRVPIDAFTSAMEGVKGYANVVEREFVGSDDVTEDYVDILARLNNAKRQEQRYLDILDRADVVEDVLAVERELVQTRELIERYQGQVNYLDSQTSLATITVQLSEEPIIEFGGKEFRPGTTVTQAAQALVAFGQWLIEAIIWIVIVGGGITLPVGLIAWAIWKLIQRRKQR